MRTVPPFQIKVLGGVFKITEVRVEGDESTETVVASITTTSEDRWFVMAAEDLETGQDTLAIIDDNMEFQIVAQGQLLPE
ncbi:MAG: hypothetical protein V3S64_08020 [bacterium]